MLSSSQIVSPPSADAGLEPHGHRHAGVLEVCRDRFGLHQPPFLSRPQDDRAAVGDDRRVEDVDRVGIGWKRSVGEHDLCAAGAECVAEGLVLFRELGDVRL